MTGLPAQVLGLADRGRIAVGAKADLVVIDLDAVRDTATWEKPDRVPAGFDAIIVNGALAAERGRRAADGAGRVLRRAGAAHEASGNGFAYAVGKVE